MDQGGLNASGINRLDEHPYLKLRGAGTMIAIIDSGIDYTHPAFRNGNQSRIVSIWDQSLPSGESEEVPYGQVLPGRRSTEPCSPKSAGNRSLLLTLTDMGHGLLP